MKKNLSILLMAGTFLFSLSCQSKSNPPNKTSEEAKQAKTTIITPQKDLSQFETAYFASGCFWCVEAIFESVRGVEEVISGYAGGSEPNPTYQQVSYGKTTHAEAVEVYYNPEEISFIELVQVFFGSHDPTSLNRQGPDRGPQYRSIAFYKNPQEQQVIQAYMKALEDNRVFDRPIVTEVVAFDKFYKAEEYHQDYERKNPNNSYIRNVSIPRLNRFKKNFGDFLKEESH